MQARLLPRRWLTCTFLLPDNTTDLWASTGHRCGSHRNAQKEKKEMSFSPWHVHMWNQSLYMARTSQNNHCALHVSTEEKCHNGFNQSRPKCRVHSPPEAFLSLIRGASSCMQPKTCLPPWWQACSQTLISNPSHILSLLTASYSIFLHDQIL